MRNALEDGHRAAEAYGVARSVGAGTMSEAEADRRAPGWRDALPLVQPDEPVRVEELVVTARGKPNWLQRQAWRLRYGLDDLLSLPEQGETYHGLQGGGFQPGDGVATPEDLREQQRVFDARGRVGWRPEHAVMTPRPPQRVPSAQTYEDLAQEAEALPYEYLPEGRPPTLQEANGALGSTFGQWIQRVRPGGQWDFKQGHPELEQWGNEAYGVTGSAIGLPPWVLKRGAGLAHEITNKDNDGYHPDFNHWWGDAPYGDDPRDQRDIDAGIERYRVRQSRRGR